MAIIGLVGFIGSGKGAVGDMIADKGWHRDSFAAPLKDAASSIFGWPRDLLEGDTEVSRKWREEPDEFWSIRTGNSNFTPRLALQLLGTEAGRNVFHPDIWVISLLNRAKGKNVVVTDVRFKNEIDYIQDNGGIVVRVKRGEEPSWFNIAKEANAGSMLCFDAMCESQIHASEWDWIGCEFDYTIENDGTLQDLGKRVDDLLQYIQK